MLMAVGCASRSLTSAPVLLQAMKEDPPPDAKCRDKFLVQTVAITADREFSNVAAIVGCAAMPRKERRY